MHGAILLELAEARRADLLREAARARRVAAARRSGARRGGAIHALFQVLTVPGIGRKSRGNDRRSGLRNDRLVSPSVDVHGR